MKITNTYSHAIAGFGAGTISAILLNMFPSAKTTISILIVAVAAYLIAIGVELYQLIISGMSPKDYLKIKWLDSLVDIIVGCVMFSIPYFILIFGVYAGNY